MKAFISWLRWWRAGKPIIHYEGYHCGLCGKWCYDPFSVPMYKSSGEWADTWGMCLDCKEGNMTPSQIYNLTLDLIKHGFIKREALEQYLYEQIVKGEDDESCTVS